MTKGSPDFSNVRNNGISLGVPSASELLNRPRDVISLNISGQCILYNDFEDGSSNGTITNSNTPNYFGIAVNDVYPGNFSYRMSTNAIISSNVQLANKVPYSEPNRCGLEAILYCNVTNAEIRQKLQFYNLGVLHEAIVKYDTSNATTYLVDDTGSFVNISSLITHDFPRPYYQSSKLVVDFTTGYYVRLLLNAVTIDISAYKYKQSVTIVNPALEYIFRVDNTTAVIADLYLDNIVMTIQEP